MSLTWHIVAKDLRRFVPMSVLWAMVIVVRTVLPSALLSGAVADVRAFDLWEALLALLLAIDLCVQCLLVAAVVQEDNVTGTNAWWLTRPIGGGRLLGAKLVTLVLLFCLLPAVALAAVWLGFGFSGGELVAALAWCVVTRAIVVVIALGAAATAASLPQFLFGSIGICFGVTALASYLHFETVFGYHWQRPAVEASGRELMAIVIVLCPAALAVHQFLTRRRRRTLLIMFVGFAVILGLRFDWTGRALPLTAIGLWGNRLAPAKNATVRVGELPLREAAELRVGARLTRIVALRREDEKLCAIIEEREPLPVREDWLDAGRRRDGPTGPAYHYELVDPASSRSARLPAGAFDSLVAGAIVTGQRRVELPDWAEGGTLVKLQTAK